MARYIEYYEIKTSAGYEYYFMPLDHDSKNKENLDNKSSRIWKFDTKTNRNKIIMDRTKEKNQLTRAELLKIQLKAKPVPYNEFYLLYRKLSTHG